MRRKRKNSTQSSLNLLLETLISKSKRVNSFALSAKLVLERPVFSTQSSEKWLSCPTNKLKKQVASRLSFQAKKAKPLMLNRTLGFRT
jgi:hypothetical protein